MTDILQPNGGKSQPGCGLDVTGSCAHSRAYKFLSEAATSNQFIAHKCKSLQDAKNGKCDDGERLVMRAELTAINVRGIYHLRTNSASPFALGDV